MPARLTQASPVEFALSTLKQSSPPANCRSCRRRGKEVGISYEAPSLRGGFSRRGNPSFLDCFAYARNDREFKTVKMLRWQGFAQCEKSGVVISQPMQWHINRCGRLFCQMCAITCLIQKDFCHAFVRVFLTLARTIRIRCRILVYFAG